MSRALLLAAMALLAGCGRTGPPRPPGPPSEVVYPRAYPAPPASAAGAQRAAPQLPLAVPLPQTR
jgi:predicted small lipoprotein YifL